MKNLNISIKKVSKTCSCNFMHYKKKENYRKVPSSNMSCLEAHPGFFRLLMKGIFDPYVKRSF